MEIFITDFDIYFEDLSPFGKVHIEKLAEWLSITRERYFKTTCPDYFKFADGSVVMFTTDASIFIQNARSHWADKITAALTTSNIKKISFEMNVEFYNNRSKEIIAHGKQKVAFVDQNTKRFASVPDDMKGVIIHYVKDGGDTVTKNLIESKSAKT